MTVRVNKSAFNIREKLSELERPIGVKGNELMRAETAQEARDFISAGRRNIIINGNFDIWQRATSTTGALSNSYASADRWMFNTRSLTTRNISRQSFTNGQTDVPGNPKYYLRFEASNDSGSYGAYIMQRIEDVRVGSGEDVTVSFYAKVNSGGGTFDVGFSQQFGSGGSSATDTTAGSFIPTSSWKKYSFTTSLPSISGKTIGTNNYLRLDIRFPSNTAATFDVSQVQVEKGRNATDFEHRSYGEELALCQRYYQTINESTLFGGSYWGSSANSAWQYSGTGGSCRIYFTTTMRTHPTALVVGSLSSSPGTDGTIGAYGNAAWMNPSSITATETTKNSVRINLEGLSGSGKDAFGLYFYGTSLTSNITLTAEL